MTFHDIVELYLKYDKGDIRKERAKILIQKTMDLYKIDIIRHNDIYLNRKGHEITNIIDDTLILISIK